MTQCESDVATMPDLISVTEAAQRIGVSAKTLMRLVNAGSIPIYRIGPCGRLRRFSEEDVAAYLRKCRKIGGR